MGMSPSLSKWNAFLQKEQRGEKEQQQVARKEFLDTSGEKIFVFTD